METSGRDKGRGMERRGGGNKATGPGPVALWSPWPPGNCSGGRVAKVDLELLQQHAPRKAGAEGRVARPPDTCSLQQGRQAPSFKGRGKVWSGAPWCHPSLHLRGGGLEGLTFFFSQASEISDIHRLKSSWKRGRCLIPQGPGPVHRWFQGAWAGVETGPRRGLPHVLAFFLHLGGQTAQGSLQ